MVTRSTHPKLELVALLLLLSLFALGATRLVSERPSGEAAAVQRALGETPEQERTVHELGVAVKQLYLRAYDNLTDAGIGRAMKRKYPEQFPDCADLPVTAVEDTRQRIRGALGFRGNELAQRYATYGAQALPNALRDPKFREEPQEIQLEALRRMDPEFARLSIQAQIAVLDDENYQPPINVR